MARPLRIEYPGAVCHVTSRGNAGNNIYENGQDREAYIDLRSEVVKKCNWHCHAYCLMENHYHLLIKTSDANFSYGMRQLNRTTQPDGVASAKISTPSQFISNAKLHGMREPTALD